MIELEPVEWRLRGAPGAFRHGDRYQVAATVVRVAPKLVVLNCMIGEVWPGMRAEIGAALVALGFDRVLWEDARGRVYDQDLHRFQGSDPHD